LGGATDSVGAGGSASTGFTAGTSLGGAGNGSRVTVSTLEGVELAAPFTGVRRGD
jgi:hypothetical protein